MAIRIIRGEDVTIAFTIDKANGDPFDLSGATEITVRFPAETACDVEVTLTSTKVVIISAVLGKLTAHLTDTDTKALRVGDGQDVQVTIDKGADTRICQIRGQLNVIDDLFNCAV